MYMDIYIYVYAHIVRVYTFDMPGGEGRQGRGLAARLRGRRRENMVGVNMVLA